MQMVSNKFVIVHEKKFDGESKKDCLMSGQLLSSIIFGMLMYLKFQTALENITSVKVWILERGQFFHREIRRKKVVVLSFYLYYFIEEILWNFWKTLQLFPEFQNIEIRKKEWISFLLVYCNCCQTNYSLTRESKVFSWKTSVLWSYSE